MLEGERQIIILRMLVILKLCDIIDEILAGEPDGIS